MAKKLMVEKTRPLRVPSLTRIQRAASDVDGGGRDADKSKSMKWINEREEED